MDELIRPAFKEVPPRCVKKLASTLSLSSWMPRVEAQIPDKRISVSVKGRAIASFPLSPPNNASQSGSGSDFMSVFPFGRRGRAGRGSTTAGIMAGSRLVRQ